MKSVTFYVMFTTFSIAQVHIYVVYKFKKNVNYIVYILCVVFDTGTVTTTVSMCYYHAHWVIYTLYYHYYLFHDEYMFWNV